MTLFRSKISIIHGIGAWVNILSSLYRGAVLAVELPLQKLCPGNFMPAV